MKIKLLVLIAAWVSLGAGSCSLWSWGEESLYSEEGKIFETSRLDTVALSLREGRIEVQASPEEKIRLRLVKKIRANTKDQAQRVLEKVQVLEKRDGSRLRIHVELAPDTETSQSSVDAFLWLPARFAVDLDTRNGSLEVRGMEGSIQAQSYSGEISVQGARDGVDLKTFSGPIHLLGEPGTLSLLSHSGRIEAKLGKLRAFQKRSRIETHSGEIQCLLPAGFSTSLQIHAEQGEIDAKFPARWQSLERFEATGSLGAGGVPLQLETHSGKIHVGEFGP